MSSIASSWSSFVSGPAHRALADAGLLLTRVSLGLMMAFGHGRGKLSMLLDGKGPEFGDPIGVGPTFSLVLAVGAEFFCALAVALGLATRLALTQLIATMAVAAFIVHGAAPLTDGEMALLYLVSFTALFLTGPGRFSLDYMILRRLAGDRP